MDIGFLGAGLMSAPMIINLVADGHGVRVWNRTSDKAEALSEIGATPVDVPAAVVDPGGVLISCLADDAALDAVLADGGVVAALADGVHVSMSTVSAACTARHAAAHAAGGAALVAAPVLGRPDAVAARAQSYLLAGPAAACARVRPLLDSLGAAVFEYGELPQAASTAKIGFNFLIAASIEAMAEAFAVMEKSNIDVHAFHDMLLNTAFGCRIFQGYGGMLASQNWDEPLFRLALGLKDVRLAQGAAAAADARMRLGELLETRYAEAVEHGLGDKDWTAIGIEIRREAGISDD